MKTRVEIMIKDNAFDLQEEINRWLSQDGSSFEIAEIKFNYDRSFDMDGNELFNFTAMIIYRDHFN